MSFSCVFSFPRDTEVVPSSPAATGAQREFRVLSMEDALSVVDLDGKRQAVAAFPLYLSDSVMAGAVRISRTFDCLLWTQLGGKVRGPARPEKVDEALITFTRMLRSRFRVSPIPDLSDPVVLGGRLLDLWDQEIMVALSGLWSMTYNRDALYAISRFFLIRQPTAVSSSPTKKSTLVEELCGARIPFALPDYFDALVGEFMEDLASQSQDTRVNFSADFDAYMHKFVEKFLACSDMEFDLMAGTSSEGMAPQGILSQSSVQEISSPILAEVGISSLLSRSAIVGSANNLLLLLLEWSELQLVRSLQDIPSHFLLRFDSYFLVSFLFSSILRCSYGLTLVFGF